MKKIGLIANLGKENVIGIASKIVSYLVERRLEVVLEPMLAEKLGKNKFSDAGEKLFHEVDLIIVLGGDGTILNVARRIGRGQQIPLLGINLGILGFLTEITVDGMLVYLERLFKGDYKLDVRKGLHACLMRGGRIIEESKALNDVVITRGSLSRILTLKISVDGEHLTRYTSDGLIISTPTGSTAYSLSAGGPIISPTVGAMLITPICPHTLTNRPIIVDKDARVEVTISTDAPEAYMTLDGQVGTSLMPGDKISIRTEDNMVTLVAFAENSYYTILRKKLQWGKSLSHGDDKD